ncbi:heme exporter protein CcmB [Chromatiales bacterium (ex Bugula neritina AB1)]|nr:heme exporter protein CcmB [Chromatiales bacterium (ex Bugula neritina AB1)]
MGQAFYALLKRDLLLALRRRADWLNPLVFFVIVVTLFPLGVGPDNDLLREIAPGVLWVAALLATLLALDGLFRSDYDDGSLEQLLLSPQPLSVLVLAKVLAHWLITGLPLLLLSPLLAVVMQLQVTAIPVLLVSLLIGTLTLSLVGGIGAALTVGLQRGGVLLALLVLPLFIPVLIFGSSSVIAAASGFAVDAQISLLGALLLLALALAPIAIAAALRISSE